MLRAVFRLKPIDRAPVPDGRVRACFHWLAYNRRALLGVSLHLRPKAGWMPTRPTPLALPAAGGLTAACC